MPPIFPVYLHINTNGQTQAHARYLASISTLFASLLYAATLLLARQLSWGLLDSNDGASLLALHRPGRAVPHPYAELASSLGRRAQTQCQIKCNIAKAQMECQEIVKPNAR